MAERENAHRKPEPDAGGNTRLHEASARGDARAVETLIGSGADVHARNARGETALHRSALRGNRETTQTLIKAGAQVNARTRQGDTPLHLAAWSGNHENISALAQAGADRNAKNHNDERPVDVAVSRGHKGVMRQGFKSAQTDKKMAYLDWMKEKPATQQPSVAKTSQQQDQAAPAPRNAKEFYAQQAAQDKAAEKPIDAQLEARATAIGERMQKATAHLTAGAPAQAAAPEGGGNAALLQKAQNQDKTQAALSPTDNVKGQTALQIDKPQQSQTKAAPTKQPTPARDGWSRGR